MFIFSRCTNDIISTFWYSFWFPTWKNPSRVSFPWSSLLWVGLHLIAIPGFYSTKWDFNSKTIFCGSVYLMIIKFFEYFWVLRDHTQNLNNVWSKFLPNDWDFTQIFQSVWSYSIVGLYSKGYSIKSHFSAMHFFTSCCILVTFFGVWNQFKLEG